MLSYGATDKGQQLLVSDKTANHEVQKRNRFSHNRRTMCHELDITAFCLYQYTHCAPSNKTQKEEFSLYINDNIL